MEPLQGSTIVQVSFIITTALPADVGEIRWKTFKFFNFLVFYAITVCVYPLGTVVAEDV